MKRRVRRVLAVVVWLVLVVAIALGGATHVLAADAIAAALVALVNGRNATRRNGA